MSGLRNLYDLKIVKKAFQLLPDKVFIDLQYKSLMKKKMNWSDPTTFNEKLQWLKIHDRKPEYTIYADKYAVRRFISGSIGEEYLVKLYGAWDNAEDIDFDSLPDQFVIKANHDSGSVIVCRDKSRLDKNETRGKMREALTHNNYFYGRDWPYKDIKPMIIAEEFLDNGAEGLIDYKFYCFNGEAKFLYISQGLEYRPTARITFYDLNGKRLPFKRPDFMLHEVDPVLPDNFKEMIDLANVLAKKVNAPFIRVDLYSVKGKIYFSELTFRPNSGYMKFQPPEWDTKVGMMLDLQKS